MQAFQNNPVLKEQAIERVRSRWAAGELLAAAALRWDPQESLYSISGALAQTSDAQAFVERTGIPLELALLCESTLALNSVTVPDKSKKIGFSFIHDPALDTAVVQWIEAIRPGADLQTVIPKFMVFFLGYVLSEGFAQGAYFTPDVRGAAEKILANWKAELAGLPVDAKVWRQIRAQAVKATEEISQAWAYPISHFVETMAWPLATMTKEFSQPYMFITGNLLAFLQAPYQAPQDQKLSELALKGHLKLRELERANNDTPEARQAMLDANPDIKEAMTWHADAERNARVKQGAQRAFAATTPQVRLFIDQLTQFIKEA